MLVSRDRRAFCLLDNQEDMITFCSQKYFVMQEEVQAQQEFPEKNYQALVSYFVILSFFLFNTYSL